MYKFSHERPVARIDDCAYYNSKKQSGLFFTQQNLDPSAPANAMSGNQPVTAPGVSYWDRKRGRYRTYEEQQQYLKEIGAIPASSPSPKGEGEREKRAAVVTPVKRRAA